MKRLVFVAAMLCISSLPAGCRRESSEPPAPSVRADATWPNVLLISVDMLRPDHLSEYGYHRTTSPNIDRLAREGVVFENAISSSSWTLPAHAALMTGLVDGVHGCTDTDKRLSDGRLTMAERFKAAGYATAGFFSGPYLHPVFGLSQGFDEYFDRTSYPQLNEKTVKLVGTVDGPAIWDASHRDVTSPRVSESVVEWINSHDHRPFFLFVHMWDVHFDFIPPKEYADRFDPDYDGPINGSHFHFNQWVNARMPERDLEHLLALYDGEIAWTDDHIGRILDALESRGLTDSTLIALVADHGTEFFEHGDKSHRKTLFDEAIRIPFVIRYPAKLPAGKRVAEQVSIIDVMPTLMELVGMPPPADVMGRSALSLVSGSRSGHEGLAISELFSAGRRMRSFRRLEHKVIVDELTGCTWVYNLFEDPSELRALSDPNDAFVRDAVRDVEQGMRWMARYAVAATKDGSQIPPQLLEKLRSLGYVSEHGTATD